MSWMPPFPPAGPPLPRCVLLTNPDNDTAKCGAECHSGHTVLDSPVCDHCFEAIQTLGPSWPLTLGT